VTALGHLDAQGDGLGTDHEVGIFDDTGMLLTSAIVPSGTTAALDGDFRFIDITPVTLSAAQQYTIAGYYTNTADAIVYATPSDINVHPGLNILGGRYQFPSSQLELPTTVGDHIYVGANFRLVPAPDALVIALLGAVPGAGLLLRRRRIRA
jgi:hypothetical protein